jgi:tRNA uridine 5-carboxymethylaminomethyl modification enzyme
MSTNRSNGDTWANLIRRPGQGSALPEDFLRESPEVRGETLYRIVYQGYMEREQREIERLKHVEKIRIPLTFDYLSIPGLRRESAMKLTHIKPLTLGQASRMSGVNPTDISLLMVAIEAGREGDSAA